MPDIILTAGTLPPPTCYATEQDRFDAYVAAIVAAFSGGLQWETSTVAPTDLTKYWLQTDANGRPVHIRKYSAADGKWDPILDIPYAADSVAGDGNAITLANTPSFNTSSAFLNGRKFMFIAPGTNSGPATLQVDGLAIKSIVKHGDTALEAGDIEDNDIIEVTYNSILDKFQMVSQPAPFTFTAEAVDAITGTGTTTVPGPGASSSISHSLGRIPKNCSVKMRCIDTQAGYSVGAEADFLAFDQPQSDSAMFPAFYWSVDTSAFTIACYPSSSPGGVVKVANKTTPVQPNAGVNMDTAKWEVVAHWI